MNDFLLRVKGLTTYLYNQKYQRFLRIVDDVSFEVKKGECVGILGESGCGKTRLIYSILSLVPDTPGVVAGEVWFSCGSNPSEINLLEGIDKCCQQIITHFGHFKIRKNTSRWKKRFKVEERIRNLCGREIALIPQESKSSLNPFYPLRRQVAGAYLRGSGSKNNLQMAVKNILSRLRIYEKADDYPHQFSGGITTRATCAIALAGNPSLLIADEPTTGLDEPLQREIMNLFAEFLDGRLPFIVSPKERSVLLITHDVNWLMELAEKIVVMYAGKVVESGGIELLKQNVAKHPYTQELSSLAKHQGKPGAHLPVLLGKVPDLTNPPDGCKFHPRCPRVIWEECQKIEPELRLLASSDGHYARCHQL